MPTSYPCDASTRRRLLSLAVATAVVATLALSGAGLTAPPQADEPKPGTKPTAATPAAATATAAATAAVSTDSNATKLPKRVVLESTRVVGTPEPPPPYRVRPALSPVKLSLPLAIIRQPGTDLMWAIHQPKAGGATRVVRFSPPAAGATEPPAYETLLEGDDTAYDVVFHPRFRDNGYVYIGSNGSFGVEKGEKKTRVTRYTVERTAPYRLDRGTATTIIEWASNGHNGGAMSFGKDGMFYVTSGDGTSDSDTNLTGQGLDHLLAKVLRLDVDGAAAGKTYRVPSDNPFVGRAGARPETWAYGLRNPWRMTVDPVSGQLWVGNNGQDLWEQVYLVKKGDNYGWSVMEGSHPFYLERKAGPTPFVKPAAEHHHSEARSLTGGVVYYGQRFPELRGAYIYGDYSTGKIWALRHDGEKAIFHQEIADTTLVITGFGFDLDGELLICDYRAGDEGGFYTLEARPAATEPVTPFPRKLSETGLFQSVAGHIPHPGLIPYTVNSPLWSDGTHKERFIGLVGADARIDASPGRGWNFPNGTVLVKSFALETRVGDPASRRWIETRLMSRQDNEWVGYSYMWNDAQTDAELVGSAGLDRDYAITTAATNTSAATTRTTTGTTTGTNTIATTAANASAPAGQTQRWHFPSRAECMVCHSRAANYTLGLSTSQMNRDHAYGDVTMNQLEALEAWGLLKDKLSKPAAELPRLTDPRDTKASLELRARSYLHANCAFCHVEAGGGNAQFQIEHHVAADQLKLIDERPVHHTYGISDARLIAPGEPDRSVLFRRVSQRGAGQMPPLSSNLVDPDAVQLLRDWIADMKKKAP
jgi:glucose/arabinose dehydrogenase